MIEKEMYELRQGKSSALADIYKETSKSVFSICFSMMRDYSLAEDMMQDTFVKVKINILQYQPGTNAKAWINTIARNVCLNELKKRKREVFVDFLVREDIKGSYDIRTRDESGIIAAVVNNLDAYESQIVLMHTLGDISLKEIAALLEKPQGTIRWQYNSALNKLRKILKKEEL